jgi:hypothetical protein
MVYTDRPRNLCIYVYLSLSSHYPFSFGIHKAIQTIEHLLLDQRLFIKRIILILETFELENLKKIESSLFLYIYSYKSHHFRLISTTLKSK